MMLAFCKIDKISIVTTKRRDYMNSLAKLLSNLALSGYKTSCAACNKP